MLPSPDMPINSKFLANAGPCMWERRSGGRERPTAAAAALASAMLAVGGNITAAMALGMSSSAARALSSGVGHAILGAGADEDGLS